MMENLKGEKKKDKDCWEFEKLEEEIKRALESCVYMCISMYVCMCVCVCVCKHIDPGSRGSESELRKEGWVRVEGVDFPL